MRFCILCVGSHGDIRPYVALGTALKRLGHQVTIASHPQVRDLCGKYGLDFAHVGGDLQDLIPAEVAWKSLVTRKGFSLEVMRALKLSLAQQLPTSLAAAQGADVLVYNPIAAAGPHLAEFLNIPSVLVMLQPEVPTKHYPSWAFLSCPSLWGFGNLLGHFLNDQLMWQSIRKTINKWRIDALKLQGMHFLGPRFDVSTRDRSTIVAVSPTLQPRPSDWGASIHMTGCCALPENDSEEIPQDLQQFLAAGEPPVYVGFGSLSPVCPESMMRSIVEVLSKRKIRSVLQGQFAGLSAMALPSHIFVAGYASHAWLFPKMRLIVNHGGVGTITAALKAGRPMMVVPFMVDQFFWAKRLEDLGVAPRALPALSVTAETFEKYLDEVFSTLKYQDRALALQLQMAGDPDGAMATARQILALV